MAIPAAVDWVRSWTGFDQLGDTVHCVDTIPTNYHMTYDEAFDRVFLSRSNQSGVTFSNALRQIPDQTTYVR